uniref:fasciclin domain-containing protein n=1 Tax=Pedobacter schmidteae TaxID=2201271 RepID=UPI000EB02C87|nr:fasciclin domain-containing protein [Pedobacter schmidteae]
MKQFKYVFIMVLSIMFTGSCKHDDLSIAKPNENIRPAADFIKNNYDMRLFYAALKKVGYTDQLNGAGPFTILVPNDAAFNELGIYNPSDFDKMNVDSLKKVIAYHILPRKLRLSDIPTNGVDVRYATLEGSELYASLASQNPTGGSPVNNLYFSGCEAERKDVVLANGALHVLNKVMKPHFSVTVQEWLAKRAEYSVFVAGLKKFGLWDQLATKGPFTVFAPDNQGLASVGITETSLKTMDAEKYLGELLFGTYMMYGKHFFISDSQVFSVINANAIYRYFLKDSSYLIDFSSGKEYPDFKVSYVITLRTGPSYSDQLLKSVSSKINAKNDNLCNNGLVHHLVDGLMRPEQAIKK